MLLPKLERTKFESKSQHTKEGLQEFKVVTKIRKNKVWKQITTLYSCSKFFWKLLPKLERTKFESKSQPTDKC